MQSRKWCVVLTGVSLLQSGQTGAYASFDHVAADQVSLKRHYQPGAVLKYEMSGSNHGWTYQLQADALVKQDTSGAFYEEIGWSNLRSNAPLTLSPASLAFRQTLSLTENKYLAVPDLSKVQPLLIGPITDLLTFYSDLFLAGKLKLDHVGQHSYFAHGKPNSWADGKRVLLGQDAIDFDLTLENANLQEHTATVVVRHVPPEHPLIQLPAKWMEAPVTDTANNFVQIEKDGDQYVAQVGKEVFEVQLKIDTKDGRILSADLQNPVIVTSRQCRDAALTQCGPPTPQTILRQVSLRLLS